MIYPNDELAAEESHILLGGGSTEPWTMQVVAALATAADASSVLEIGTYEGYGSAWLMHALASLPSSSAGRTFTGLEIDETRAAQTRSRLSTLYLPRHIDWRILTTSSLDFLTSPGPRYDFVWLDGDHDRNVVEKELEALINGGRCLPGGIICVHDVIGPFGLRSLVEEAGGYVLSFPKLHVAGGLGIIQL